MEISTKNKGQAEQDTINIKKHCQKGYVIHLQPCSKETWDKCEHFISPEKEFHGDVLRLGTKSLQQKQFDLWHKFC